jgi:hypothetical protein
MYRRSVGVRDEAVDAAGAAVELSACDTERVEVGVGICLVGWWRRAGM